MQKHLPLADPILKHLRFLDPDWRSSSTFTTSAVYVAKHFKRFTSPEIIELQVQLSHYKALGELPSYNVKDDRVDDWWVKVWKILESKTGTRPTTLIKLVKMSLVLAHSQGWVERGFSLYKWFADDRRNSLSVRTIKGLKLVHGEVKRRGT